MRLPAIREAQIKSPAEMFAIGESRFKQETGKMNPNDGVDAMYCGYLTNLPPSKGRIHLPARHGENYNQLFCDGHLQAIDPWILFNPANTAPMWNNDNQPHPELWPSY
jgi:prepilin-type processing-associated H-X9-DG protein